MPRSADAQLADKILETSYKLLHQKGEVAITLRDVAKAAGTTTPTVYKRFKNKEALLVGVAARTRQVFNVGMMRQRTMMKACEFYLDFARNNPADYALVYRFGWPSLFEKRSDQPGLQWGMERLAEKHGGDPDEYWDLAHALWFTLHGAGSMLTKRSNARLEHRIRELCLKSCKSLIENGPKIYGS